MSPGRLAWPMPTYRLYRKIARASEQDVPPLVWELRHYWHCCRNCPGWPNVPYSRWRSTNPKADLLVCQACVGLVRMGACDEPESVRLD